MDEGDAVVGAELQLVADEHGLAVLGSAEMVERFLAAEGLVASGPASTGLGVTRLSGLLGAGSATAQAGSGIAENSGRWVKLSEESARSVKKYGLRQSSKTGFSTGVVKGEKGQVRGYVEFVRGPGAALTNPAMLAGAAWIMAQLASQQKMEEITDYLRTIDAKLDDVIRAQKDSVVSRLTGAGMAIDEAITVSRARGKVDEVTWSKVQNLTTIIAEVQGYALAQLDGLAAKIESANKLSDIADTTSAAAASTQEWLAVLARTFQLQEALDVLELDRVLDASPEEVGGHRRGLEAARRKRLSDIGTATGRLLERIVTAAQTANDRVLLHPAAAPRAVRSSERVGSTIINFHELLGLVSDREALEARRWSAAASDVRDRAIETGSDGVAAIRRGGGAAYLKAREGVRRSAHAVPPKLRVGRSAAVERGDPEDR